MKTKTYKNRFWTLKAFQKTAGDGYEVSLYWGKTQIFVGNFIHSSEANQWWTTLNKEVRTFWSRYYKHHAGPETFYRKFLTNQLYRSYYAWLDKRFTKYQRTYTTAFKRDVKRFNRYRKGFHNTNKTAFRSTAA